MSATRLVAAALLGCCLLVVVPLAGAGPVGDVADNQTVVAGDTLDSTQAGGDRLEPNDDRSDATAVGDRGSYDDLSIHSRSDEDYFAVDAGAGDVVGAEISFSHASGDLDLQIVDESGSTVANSISISDDEAVTHTAGSAGTYYVVVYGYSGAINDYDLAVEVTDADEFGDRLEPNDDEANATDLGDGGSESDLDISTSEDEDFFAVDAEAGELVTAEATFSHYDGDLDMEIRDPSGEVATSSISITDDERVSHVADSEGTYYVVVYGYSGATNGYDLTAETTTLAADGDRLEPNGDRASATPLGSGASYDDLNISAAVDEDSFAVETEAGGTISADIEFNHGQSDLDMALLNASGERVAVSQSATDDEHIEYTADSEGTYYVVVYAFAGEPNEYDLSVTTTDTGSYVAPTAVAEASPPAVYENGTVTLSGGNSSDGDGIESYAWDFGGDGATDATGQTVTHTFTDPGGYDVTLTVTGGDGATDTDTVTVGVVDPENCSAQDFDDDGLTGCEETAIGTDPTDLDTDGDGFPDGAEVNREDLLPDADPLRFDVYVEVDYIDSNPMSERNYERIREGLDSDRFQNPGNETGMALHVVEGEEIDQLGDANNPAAYRRAYQNDTYACAGYHYAMVTEDQPWATALGVGQPGAFIVTDNSTGDTFMHELGHSLGLGYRGTGGELHGTYEYSYFQYGSVMNYAFPPLFPLSFSDGTESDIAHDDWGSLNESAYTPGWEGGC
jgi:PKD repeat protein